MLKFQEFFHTCTGRWTTERTYHSILAGQVERSYTEFQVEPITKNQKQQILSSSATIGIKADLSRTTEPAAVLPGFAISFDTRSETGATVSMSLQALFVPDSYVLADQSITEMPLPIAARVTMERGVLVEQSAPRELTADSEVIQGFYLRNEGYSEVGAVAGRFTYQSTRQTLEMTTYYRRSVAVDQMRMVAPDLRLRTIITYQRPTTGSEAPSIIDLVGFGVEKRQSV